MIVDLQSCRAPSSHSDLKSNEDYFAMIESSSDSKKLTIHVSSPLDGNFDLCLESSDEKCDSKSVIKKSAFDYKIGAKFVFKFDVSLSATPNAVFRLLNSASETRLRFKLKDLRQVDTQGSGNSEDPLPGDFLYTVDITGNDVLSGGKTPRSRTGAFISKDYLITCMHNHQKIKMDDSLEKANWWTNQIDLKKPLYKSTSAVKNRLAPDLIVQSAENFPELDLAILKVSWTGDIPEDQVFPDFVVLDGKSAKENQDVAAVGFPRERYLPDAKATVRRGNLKFWGESEFLVTGFKTSLGDSGAPVVFKNADGKAVLLGLIHSIESDKMITHGTSLKALYSKSETFRKLFDSTGKAIPTK
ncbi:MAG: serine protease [Proteobacteria bacterium]|nr:serine protease [Pseudomonadota bacterium]